MKVSIGQAAKELGVSNPTLRRWEAEGKYRSVRTPKGHRRYDRAHLPVLKPYAAGRTNRRTVCYAGGSSRDQKEDLVRQGSLLETVCAVNGWPYAGVQDVGSGLNDNPKGMPQLIQWVCSGTVGGLVQTNQDRRLRLGSELVFSQCEANNAEVVIINQGEQPLSEEAELVPEVLELIAVFSARWSGSGSPKNRKLVETLREVAEQR